MIGNRRTTGLLIGGAGVAVLAAGLLLRPLLRPPVAEVPAPPPAAPTTETLAAPAPVDPAAQARAAAVRQEIDLLRQECQDGAGGDYARWAEQLRPYLAELRDKIQAAKPYNPTATETNEARCPVLAGKDDFPLFEAYPEGYLAYVVQPERVDAAHIKAAVVAASRWFKRQGIDLLFVPVPKMTEVYPEHFADHCPADRIVAPHLRRLWRELSEADVEVVDLLPLFLAERDKGDGPLYQPADPHWAPRGMALAAAALAERLKRYDFVQQALAGPAACKAVEVPCWPMSSCAAYLALDPEQRRLAAQVHPHTYLAVADSAGGAFESAQSPVLFIGDSYNNGLTALVAHAINLPVFTQCGGGQRTQAFKNFVRNPDLLKDRKVVIWLVCDTAFQLDWPLPPSVTEAGE